MLTEELKDVYPDGRNRSSSAEYAMLIRYC